MSIREKHQEEIKDLYSKGFKIAKIVRFLIDEYNLVEPFDTVRGAVRYCVGKHANSPENRKPECKHEALVAECEASGINVEDVNYFWYKSQKFSINASNNSNPIDKFNSYVETVRDTIASSFEWENIKYDNVDGDNLFMPNIFDLHLGKLAHHAESGEDYDIKIAERRFNEALDDLISKASGYSFSKILFPIGNDLFNSDRSAPFSQTSAGTPQHDDSRWFKMFNIGHAMITQAIIRLAKIAPVDVVAIQGNHDTERVFYLGEVLSAVFKNHPNVTVDNQPIARKYYKHGKCLIALAHGDRVKVAQLPLLMAQEAPKMWADTWYREWILGHLHHKQQLLTQTAKDYQGVRVTYLTSPSGTDAWHHKAGYVGAIKGAEAFIYNSEEGLVGSVCHNIRY